MIEAGRGLAQCLTLLLNIPTCADRPPFSEKSAPVAKTASSLASQETIEAISVLRTGSSRIRCLLSRRFATQRMAAVRGVARQVFDCLHSSAVLSSACRLLCYVGYNGFISGRIKASGDGRVLDRLEHADPLPLRPCGGRINAPRVP